MNKLYSLQRFEVNASLVDNRYNNFDYLDFLGKNGTATWHWSATPYFYGRLTGNHREALQNFADITGFLNSTTKNLRTDNNARFDAVLELDGAWRLIGALAYDVRTNSRLLVQDFDNRVASVEGGVRYAFPSGSSLTYKVRAGNGDFFKREQPNYTHFSTLRFNEMEHELRLIWLVTGKASIDARAGHYARDHTHIPQRDFDGFVGNFNLNWAVTSKTRVVLGWARDLGNMQLAPGSFQNSPLLSSHFPLAMFLVQPGFLCPGMAGDGKGCIATALRLHPAGSFGGSRIVTGWKPYRYAALGFDSVGLAANASPFY